MIALTIVMPSFNQGGFIEEAVTSVLNNLAINEKIEFIIKDNCSDDSTAEYLTSLVSDKRVNIQVEKDNGQSDALFNAFKNAKGEVLCWLNSDDVLLTGSLKTVIDHFKKNESTDVLYGKALFMNKEGHITNIYPTGEFDASLLLNTCYLSQPSVFFRRSIYQTVGGINPCLKYCLDYDLWIRFSLANAKFTYITNYLSVTREYSETKTATGGSDFVSEIAIMLKENINELPSAWVLYNRYEQLKSQSSLPKHWLYSKAWAVFLINYKGTKKGAFIVLNHHVRQRVINQYKVLKLRGKKFSELVFNKKG